MQTRKHTFNVINMSGGGDLYEGIDKLFKMK